MSPSDASTGGTRCFVCGARDWRDAGPRLRCSHCAVEVRRDGYDVQACRAALERVLLPGARFSADDVDAPFVMDAFTLRIAASAVPLAVAPIDPVEAASLAHPHGPPARCRLVQLPPPSSPSLPPPFALGGIARPDAASTLARRMVGLAPPDAAVILAIDAASHEAGIIRTSLRDDASRVIFILRPLAADFAAQRNAVQDAAKAAGASWTLQIDDDETLDPGGVDVLRALTGQADAQGTVSIGLRRRNLVDGVASDLWPDVQYRLNRSSVRYRGRVHERPDAGGWRRTTIALRGTLDHHLDGARVRERSVAYEAMRAGAGRRGDEAALLRPFSP